MMARLARRWLVPALLVAVTPGHGRAAAKPNILFIAVDDLNHCHLDRGSEWDDQLVETTPDPWPKYRMGPMEFAPLDVADQELGDWEAVRSHDPRLAATKAELARWMLRGDKPGLAPTHGQESKAAD